MCVWGGAASGDRGMDAVSGSKGRQWVLQVEGSQTTSVRGEA